MAELTRCVIQRHHELVANNMMCVGFAVLIYDHSITFGYEIDFIWKAPKSLVSMIFLLNRYLAPAVILVQFYEKFLPTHSSEFCRVWVLLQGYLTIVSYVSLHAVVALRLAAMYGNSCKIKVFVSIAGLFYVLASIGFFGVVSSRILIAGKFSLTGACLQKAPHVLWIAYLPTVVIETLLFSFTVYSATILFTNYKNLDTLYHTLFRDGAVYFLVITCSSTTTLLIWAKASGTLLELARPFSLCIVTVAGSRLILNPKVRLLEESQSPSQTKTPMNITSPDFEFRTNTSWNAAVPDDREA